MQTADEIIQILRTCIPGLRCTVQKSTIQLFGEGENGFDITVHFHPRESTVYYGPGGHHSHIRHDLHSEEDFLMELLAALVGEVRIIEYSWDNKPRRFMMQLRDEDGNWEEISRMVIPSWKFWQKNRVITERILVNEYELASNQESENEEKNDLPVIGLQEKTQCISCTIEPYWFEKTLFHRITLPLIPFHSGLEYEEQPADTSIRIEWLRLDPEALSKPEEIVMNRYSFPDAESSVYLGGAHNSCYIETLVLRKIDNDIYKAGGLLFVNLEDEGVAQNEAFIVDTHLSYISETTDIQPV